MTGKELNKEKKPWKKEINIEYPTGPRVDYKFQMQFCLKRSKSY
jgi:hypothetical protein